MINDLTDGQLSRWIAEKLEPLESLPKENVSPSPLGFWHRPRVFTGHTFDHSWQPRDMVNDPAMTVMLLANRKFVSLNQIEDCDEGPWEACFCKHAQHSIACEAFATVMADTMQRAVAEAFALANGFVS